MNDLNLKAKKIALVQSEHAETVIELMRDCIDRFPLVADTEWGTLVNAVRLDTQSNMLSNMITLINDIKQGKINE